jgi:hypothetical protein
MTASVTSWIPSALDLVSYYVGDSLSDLSFSCPSWGCLFLPARLSRAYDKDP